MITIEELLKGKKLEDLSGKVRYNLHVLVDRLNVIREAYGKPMMVTSGFRSREDHLRIYKELAVKRHIEFNEEEIPWGSQHLTGAAADIADPLGVLHIWCMANIPILEETCLWIEAKDDQPRVHFQINPPKSGSRVFKP